MVTVPAVTPVTVPPELTVAIVLLLLLQAPPEIDAESVLVPPVHTDVVPEIVAEVEELTVTDIVATAVPQLLFTV